MKRSTPAALGSAFESRWWRVPATGLCFLVFFGGAALFACAVTVLRLLIREQARRGPLIHSLLRRSLAFFRHLMSFLGLVRFRIRGDLPKGPFVLVSNHPTLIDAPLLLGLIPNATCIVKNSLERSWSYHVAIDELGYIPNGESQHFIERCIAAVRGGRPLLIFPEGTRSDSLRSFERGAATIALRAGVPLLAAVLTCDPPMLGKGSRWYEVPVRSVDFTISIEYPQFFAQNDSVIPDSDASAASLQRAQTIRITTELENFYRGRLANE